VRVGAEGWRVPAVTTEPPKPRVIDAELLDEDDDAHAAAAPRRATR
jgi:hypothetical protein